MYEDLSPRATLDREERQPDSGSCFDKSAYDRCIFICRAELRRVLDVKMSDRYARRITAASLPIQERAQWLLRFEYLAGSNGSLGRDIGEKGRAKFQKTVFSANHEANDCDFRLLSTEWDKLLCGKVQVDDWDIKPSHA